MGWVHLRGNSERRLIRPVYVPGGEGGVAGGRSLLYRSAPASDLAGAWTGSGCAEVWVEAAMLSAEPDSAVGIISGSECQTVGSTLLVVDIGEVAGVSLIYGRWAYGGGAGDRRGCDGRRNLASYAIATVYTA